MKTNQYIELKIKTPDPNLRQTLIGFLSGSGFNGFWEEADELIAYVQEENYDSAFIEKQLKDIFKVPYSISIEKEKNWNRKWEENFSPIKIGNRVFIRAEFHPPEPSGNMLELIVQPQMSFGTGHHETTRLMVQMMLEEDFSGKTVIDMGTGTGVLAVLAEKLGAEKIYAIDNDPWAYRNALENMERNRCVKIHAMEGDAQTLENLPPAHFFLANINKNILLQDFHRYVSGIRPGGKLIVSGILRDDREEMLAAAKKNGLTPVNERRENDWLALKFALSPKNL